MPNKKYFFILISFLFFFLLIFEPQVIRQSIKKILPTEVRQKIKIIVFGKDYIDRMRFYHEINYNEKKLPYTQFEELLVSYIDVDKLIKKTSKNHYKKNPPMKTAFLEILNDKILIISNYGEIITLNETSPTDSKSIDTNLSGDIKIVGSHLEKDRLYLALFNNKFDNKGNLICSTLSIKKSKININDKYLTFENVFKSNDCNGIGASGVEIAVDDKKKKLYFTTGATAEGKDLAQKDNSIYGKVIMINLIDNSFKIYSKGHRNPQGLIITTNGNIISTEHGPYGGDEINKIEENKNYGWPISSYGEKYTYKINENYEYKKNHINYGFKEPIFSFVPSIGISRIKDIPEKFSSLMINNFLISSLNRRSVFRVRFDKNFDKLIFYEEIRVGGRVRDIAYRKSRNQFLLYLEDLSKVMILESNN